MLGPIFGEFGIRDELFIATKVDREGAGGGVARVEASLEKIGTGRVDLMQVHDLRDARTQLETMRSWREQGRIRYPFGRGRLPDAATRKRMEAYFDGL